MAANLGLLPFFLLFLRNYVKFLGKSFRLSFYFCNFGGRNKNN